MKFNGKRFGTILLILIMFSIYPVSTSFSSEDVTVKSWQEEMLNRVNKIRVEKKSPPLKLCAPLELAAQKYADYMARENFLSHTGKDGSKVGDRLTRAGYLWKSSNTSTYIGENIAAGQQSVKEVVSGWVKSPGHYKNLISKNFTHVGFGQSKSTNSKYGIYWVQNFGSGVKC